MSRACLRIITDQRATAVFYEGALRGVVSVKMKRSFLDLGEFDKRPDKVVGEVLAQADPNNDFFLILFDGEEPSYFNDRKARSRQIRDHFMRRGVPERHIASWVVMPTTEALYLSTPELRDMVADYPRRSPPSRAELETLGRAMRHSVPDRRRVERAVLSGTKKSKVAAAAAACVAEHGLPDDIPCINAIRASLLAWSARP